MATATRRFRALAWIAPLLATAVVPNSASGQYGAGGAPPQGPSFQSLFASPTPHQVFQRDRDGKANVPVTLKVAAEGDKIYSVSLVDTPDTARATGENVEGVRFIDGMLLGVPVGGPYTIAVSARASKRESQTTLGPFYVGDLWVLAGQSNMQGVGDLIDVAPPNPKVMALGMDGKWTRAEEPLHWLVDSPDPVHSGDPATREERSAAEHKNRPKGAGLGLPFAEAMVKATGVPVGLVICAHGGTSMAQWSPAKKDEGGNSLYGSMLRQVGLAGGKVKGVLWYQGESDANADAAPAFRQNFTDFIGAVRSDFGQPELPFYYVQIGRFVRENDPGPWNLVQDAQRTIPDRVPNTAVISVIDLELDDLIHVGTQGLKRAGRRLANIALRELFGQVGATTPTLDRVGKVGENTLVVKFKGVSFLRASSGRTAGAPGLRPDRHIAGFSIRDESGKKIPLIFEATLGDARDTVVLKLVKASPEKASLWYGYGLDPYCNLTDSADAAVPAFGPIPLDDLND